MSVLIHVPAPLRKLTGGKARVEAGGATVRELIDQLDQEYNGMGAKLVDENRGIHPYINIYVNDEDIRFLDGMDTRLQEGDTISIVPAMAGGH